MSSQLRQPLKYLRWAVSCTGSHTCIKAGTLQTSLLSLVGKLIKLFNRCRTIELISTGVNLKALRILRVLRPLRTIKASPSIRRQVSTLVKSLPEIGNAALFIGFISLIFGIMGLQQFQGVMYYRCRLTEKPLNTTYWPKSQVYTRVCSPKGEGYYSCPSDLHCGSPLQYGISLEDDRVYSDSTVQFGIATFDNIAQSMIGVIQILFIQDWTLLMNNVRLNSILSYLFSYQTATLDFSQSSTFALQSFSDTTTFCSSYWQSSIRT